MVFNVVAIAGVALGIAALALRRQRMLAPVRVRRELPQDDRRRER